MIRADDQTVFLIDLGLAELFRNPATYKHIPYSTDQSFVGTLPFTSINGQQGHAQSRRDDLESLAYTIIYSARGSLPWSSLSSRGDREAVLQKKSSITVENLCKGVPAPFVEFIKHVRSLGFREKPDYEYLQSIISQCSQLEIESPDEVPSSPPCSGDDSESSDHMLKAPGDPM
jgi:serine/threonine protein kinase